MFIIVLKFWWGQANWLLPTKMCASTHETSIVMAALLQWSIALIHSPFVTYLLTQLCDYLCCWLQYSSESTSNLRPSLKVCERDCSIPRLSEMSSRACPVLVVQIVPEILIFMYTFRLVDGEIVLQSSRQLWWRTKTQAANFWQTKTVRCQRFEPRCSSSWMSTSSCWMWSWPWTWRSMLTANSWKERKKGNEPQNFADINKCLIWNAGRWNLTGPSLPQTEAVSESFVSCHSVSSVVQQSQRSHHSWKEEAHRRRGAGSQ